MLAISILCVGKLREPHFTAAAREYEKRLTPYLKLNVVEVPETRLPDKPSQAEIDAALFKEAAEIRKKLPSGAVICALCVEGACIGSEEFSKLLSDLAVSGSSKIVFIIGGSYGLDARLKSEADRRLSMSPMTFPHHLARVMLLEQLYRAVKIAEGSAYHK